MYEHFKEWVAEVWERWWAMLVALIPLTGGTVVIAIWLTKHGMEWWWIALYILAVILFIVLSFYAFHKVANDPTPVYSPA